MRVSLKEKKKQYRAIYEAVFNTPRISINDVASILHVDRNTASNRMEEALDLEFIGGPHIRKRSFSNLREYVYFGKFDDPEESYLHYREDENVVFLAMMDGFADLWITSTRELKIEGDTIIGGTRSDYYGAFAPDHTWETAKRLMKKKVDKFDPADYEPMNLIDTHWNEVAEWDAEFEILYRELKYNLRKKQTPIRKKYLISGSKIQKWFERLPEYCTIITSYFPEGYRNYDPYFLIVETDYEDFVIDLFSELPTSSFFFKISDKLFIYIFANKYFLLGNANDPASELSKLFLRILVKNLLKKGIIRSESHARLECYCQMNF
ncbi:MAG: hypothetical protein HXS44_17005 [Theionarchaea archaeon]|nr:hypothetical protein [Theionarchaea archaeon]